jgi:hypothetical protein
MQVQSGTGTDGGAGGASTTTSDTQQTTTQTTDGGQSTTQTTQSDGGQQTQQTQQTTTQTTEAPKRPDWAPETFWDATKGELKGEDIGKILASHAERQADIITDPAKVAIKSDLKGKDGNPIVFNTESPLLKAAAEMGAKRGWTNGDLSAMAEIVATAQLAAAEAEDAEILALGNGDRGKADARLQAVLTKGAALIAADEKGNPSPEATKALSTLVASIHSRGEFETLEKLINAAGGPNAAAAGGGGEVVDIAKRWYPNEGKKAG